MEGNIMNKLIIMTIVASLVLAFQVQAMDCEKVLTEVREFARTALKAQKKHGELNNWKTEEKFERGLSRLYNKVDEALAACPQHSAAIIAEQHRLCN